jgi:hypothetical protein
MMNDFRIVVSPTDSPQSAQEKFAAFLKEHDHIYKKLGANDVIRDGILSDDGLIKHQFRIRSSLLEPVH